MEEFKINVASFEDGERLQEAFLAAIKDSGVKMSDLMDTGENLDKLVNIALTVNNSKDVKVALWACLLKSTYKGEKITKATFEDPETRQHYFPVMAKCIEVNVAPFIVGLRFLLGSVRNPEQ